MGLPRLLVVTAAPDERPSTAVLEDIVATLRAAGHHVDVWFLRPGPRGTGSWGDARVVDSLRTWLPARVLHAVGLRTLASFVRGRRLRRWLAESAPDLVVLDDGLGGRAVEHVGADVKVAVRINPTLPDDAPLEPPPVATADLWIVAEGEPADDLDGGVRITEPVLRDVRLITARSAPPARASTRDRYGLPADVPLVVGWGRDDWLDGADLFVRVLWHLEHHHGTIAHGAWIGSEEPSDRHRTELEAERCGVAGRITRVPFRSIGDVATSAVVCAADAVFLPSRDVIEDVDAVGLRHAGLVVVAFDCSGLPDATLVADLDLDAAAERLARALRADTRVGLAAEAAGHDAARWPTDVLAVAFAEACDGH